MILVRVCVCVDILILEYEYLYCYLDYICNLYYFRISDGQNCVNQQYILLDHNVPFCFNSYH